MRVLFIALGSTRMPTVIDEANEVIADGGSAVVLVDQISSVNFRRFDRKVKIVRLAEVVQTVPGTVSWWLLFKAPQLAAYAVARGPLRGTVRGLHDRYALRIARMARKGNRFTSTPVEGNRMHQDVFDYVLWHTVLRAQPFDLMVVADPVSMPTGRRLMSAPHRVPIARRIAFTVDAVVH